MNYFKERQMLPAGPLMIEHRLIEKIIPILKKEAGRIGRTGEIDPDIIRTSVDFFRTYADKCHHGKEEDILFRELAKKKMTPEHSRIMAGLLDDHVKARKLVGRLASVADPNEAVSIMGDIAELYTEHIKKEDRDLFVQSMEYFTVEEKDRMLDEFYDFDARMIHEKYKAVIAGLEGS